MIMNTHYYYYIHTHVTQLVHLTALLFLGNTVEVGHLMHRTLASSIQNDALLQEWYNVVACSMLERDTTRCIQGLQHVASNLPAPFQQYAADIMSQYLQRKEEEECSNVERKSMVGVGPVVAFLETAQFM